MSESKESIKNAKAVALKYNSETDAGPVVVAAGNGFVAQKILEIAQDCGVAVYHDDTAATLLSRLDLGQEIPPALYQIVVEMYLAVMQAATDSRKTL